jgi:hypothetical protein
VHNETYIVDAADANIAELLLRAAGITAILKRCGSGCMVKINTLYGDHHAESIT